MPGTFHRIFERKRPCGTSGTLKTYRSLPWALRGNLLTMNLNMPSGSSSQLASILTITTLWNGSIISASLVIHPYAPGIPLGKIESLRQPGWSPMVSFGILVCSKVWVVLRQLSEEWDCGMVDFGGERNFPKLL